VSSDDALSGNRSRRGEHSGSGALSWKVGPADSRLVRVLTYLAEGFLGGALLFAVFDALWGLVFGTAAGNSLGLGVAALFVVLLARWVWFTLWARRATRHADDPGRWMTREWLEVYRLRWVVVLTMLVGGGLLAADSFLSLHGDDSESLWFGAMLVSVGCILASGLLSTRGELDADSLTLTTYRYGERRELDLRTLTATKRLTLGNHTLLWLSVTPGVEKRTAMQGFYAIPTPVLDRGWSAFEAGLAADPPMNDETVERGRFFRRVNRFVAAGVLLLALGALVGLAWLGSPLVQLLIFGWTVGLFSVFLLKLAA
jgi:hypothetical protein